jgi:uncharacterized protein
MTNTKWIHRYYEEFFGKMLKKGKVLVIYGPRQVGKTSLVNFMLKDEVNFFKGDGMDINLMEILGSQRLSTISSAFRGYKIVFIDEAQKINNIGNALKLLVDHEPEIAVIASGSSSFDLSNKLGEPLTGRQNVYYLFPISILELIQNTGGMEVIANLDNLMIFGTYPEILTASNNERKTEYLISLRNAYLFKDILELESIKNPSKLTDILRLLAYQIGNEVSLNELSNQLGMAKQTVEKYIDLLEKVFIIKKIQGYSSNLRKEVTKTHRYYFWDNGIRNALINNFNPLNLRNDKGMLWENMMVMERLKTQEYLRIFSNNFFWRTYDKKEIDFVEERDGKLYGYEFKWEAKQTKAPKLWKDTYPDAEYAVIDRHNFVDFLSGK